MVTKFGNQCLYFYVNCFFFSTNKRLFIKVRHNGVGGVISGAHASANSHSAGIFHRRFDHNDNQDSDMVPNPELMKCSTSGELILLQLKFFV